LYEQEVIKLVKINPAYMGTVDGNRPRVRPMSPYIDESGHIWLITKVGSKKIDELLINPRVDLVTFSDGKMVNIYGRVMPEKPKSEWLEKIFVEMPAMSNYFNGVSDPSIVVYRMIIYEIAYYNGQKTVTSGINLDIESDPDKELRLCQAGFCLND